MLAGAVATRVYAPHRPRPQNLQVTITNPCDGDFDQEEPELWPTWCFTQDGCGKTPKANADGTIPPTWDYCHPPLTTTATSTTVTATTTTTIYDIKRTENGCACEDRWSVNCDGKATTFSDCTMDEPCDDDNNQGDPVFSTWCFVKEGCPTAQLSLEDVPWDHCRPLPAEYRTTAAPTTTPEYWTHDLLADADPAATTIIVSEQFRKRLAVKDRITFGEGTDAEETVKITQMSTGGKITFDPPLQFAHVAGRLRVDRRSFATWCHVCPQMTVFDRVNFDSTNIDHNCSLTVCVVQAQP
jgi:hypothetical protein